MNLTRDTVASLCLALLFTLGTAVSSDGQSFVDDFSDGNAEDGMPVNWAPGAAVPLGSRVVSDGSYLMTTESGNPMSAYAQDRIFQDVSVQTQVRILDDFVNVPRFASSSAD
jgi:hypothetical protein